MLHSRDLKGSECKAQSRNERHAYVAPGVEHRVFRYLAGSPKSTAKNKQDHRRNSNDQLTVLHSGRNDGMENPDSNREGKEHGLLRANGSLEKCQDHAVCNPKKHQHEQYWPKNLRQQLEELDQSSCGI